MRVEKFCVGIQMYDFLWTMVWYENIVGSWRPYCLLNIILSLVYIPKYLFDTSKNTYFDFLVYHHFADFLN